MPRIRVGGGCTGMLLVCMRVDGIITASIKITHMNKCTRWVSAAKHESDFFPAPLNNARHISRTIHQELIYPLIVVYCSHHMEFYFCLALSLILCLSFPLFLTSFLPHTHTFSVLPIQVYKLKFHFRTLPYNLQYTEPLVSLATICQRYNVARRLHRRSDDK